MRELENECIMKSLRYADTEVQYSLITGELKRVEREGEGELYDDSDGKGDDRMYKKTVDIYPCSTWRNIGRVKLSFIRLSLSLSFTLSRTQSLCVLCCFYLLQRRVLDVWVRFCVFTFCCCYCSRRC